MAPSERKLEASPNISPLRSAAVVLESQVFQTGSSPAEKKIMKKRRGIRQSTGTATLTPKKTVRGSDSRLAVKNIRAMKNAAPSMDMRATLEAYLSIHCPSTTPESMAPTLPMPSTQLLRRGALGESGPPFRYSTNSGNCELSR